MSNHLSKQIRINRLWLPNEEYKKLIQIKKKYMFEISDLVKLLLIKQLSQEKIDLIWVLTKNQAVKWTNKGETCGLFGVVRCSPFIIIIKYSDMR